MEVRAPDIQPDEGELVWSKVPEFSLAYNAYSVAIPYFEYYLNNVMNSVRAECGAANPALDEELATFVKQEVHHSRYHQRFNKRMFDAGISELKPLVEAISEELKQQRASRSLAFNVAYCMGFESIATFGAQYLWEECDELFADADRHGANLVLWHVAEEFEHRAVCHDAYRAVSGNYFLRLYGLVYAFRRVGGAFMRAEAIVMKHHRAGMSAAERKASERRSRQLLWRQIRYLAPRMLKIFLPFYDPARIPVPPRIAAGLQRFASDAPITWRMDPSGAAA